MSYITIQCDTCQCDTEVWVDDIYDEFYQYADKDDLVEDLRLDGWIDVEDYLSKVRNCKDVDFNNALVKLAQNRIQLTKEEEELILKIANKF
jgi:hypothetical protein